MKDVAINESLEESYVIYFGINIFEHEKILEDTNKLTKKWVLLKLQLKNGMRGKGE